MEALTAIYLLSGVLVLGVIWHFIHSNRKNARIRQLEQEVQEQLAVTTLLQERFEQVSQHHEQNKSLLESANMNVQQSAVEIARLKQDLEHKTDLLQESTHLKDKLEQQLETLRQQDKQQQNTLTKLKTEHEQMLQTNIEKLALLEDAKTKLALEFKELANRIFDEKQSKMTASSKETLDSIIRPMQKDMSEFRSRIEQVHKEDIEARTSLGHHLNDLKALNQQMSQDALNLTQALKGESKTQGNWGEMILQRLLESSGLREGHEFKREQTFRNDEGKTQKPDVVIYMPGDKQIVIDAKVSLTDYERAISCTDKDKQKAFIQAHVVSMKKQIKTLTDKRYDHLDIIHTPDYVLMFVPIEGAYLMAIEADSSIFESAFDDRVAVVTPSTLYATLKLVEQLWRYERQSENVAKLTKQAGSLHDKFSLFASSFKDIETHLERAQKSYDNALGQLKDGKNNIVTQVKKLADLSGKAKKEIPKYLLDESNDEPLSLENNDGEKQ